MGRPPAAAEVDRTAVTACSAWCCEEVGAALLCILHSIDSNMAAVANKERNQIIPDGAKFKFVANMATRYNDEDNQLVLNNAVYLTLFEEARCRYFGNAGLCLLPDSLQFPFTLHSTTIRFVSPGRGGKESVKVWVKTIGLSVSSLTQLYRVEWNVRSTFEHGFIYYNRVNRMVSQPHCPCSLPRKCVSSII